MSEPNSVIRDVVAELAQQNPDVFADFWAKPKDQQSELIERYGTYSDRAGFENLDSRLSGFSA